MGDGGAVSGSEELIDQIKRLRDHGRTEKYLHTQIGWNHRLDGLQASILCAKHPYVDQWNTNRQVNALGCHQQPAYNTGESLPNTEYVSKHCLSLPIYPLITQEELNYVVDCLTEYFDSK